MRERLTRLARNEWRALVSVSELNGKLSDNSIVKMAVERACDNAGRDEASKATADTLTRDIQEELADAIVYAAFLEARGVISRDDLSAFTRALIKAFSLIQQCKQDI